MKNRYKALLLCLTLYSTAIFPLRGRWVAFGAGAAVGSSKANAKEKNNLENAEEKKKSKKKKSKKGNDYSYESINS